MRVLDFFDRIYVINLPYRRDRRQQIEQELRAAGMPFAPGQVELFDAIRPDSAGEFPSIGYRGAFLSHLAVLKRAQAEQLQTVLVMEDDLMLFDCFKEYEESLIEQLSQRDWDIIHFGYEPQQGNPADDQSGVTLQPCFRDVIGTHFYGVNRKALAPLIQFLEAMLQRPPGHPEGGPMSPDGALNMFCIQNPAIVRLITIPCLGKQRSSRSDISSKWFDQVPVLKELVNVARNTGLVNQIKQLLKR
ncbi:glycosyltransferase family 25 protein [Leptodesmis sichuanensis]|uniref:glycosyltransferase family 25 protein n=1 Tax=Leptodesmis sichuanensis TaxID=2906798 RepID=UPI001F47B85A|nr:glycosyltransferase family 25 protein [Leptodesmis sichuanensis]UIE36712.1 glycosyltransferase family 25 protein [Leptodesmis sichuanensis A121]